MLNCEQLTEFVIKPALDALQMNSPAAVELMIFTCAVESEGGYYLKQVKGPALGIYQMEPVTHNDIWQNYIKGKGDLIFKLMSNFGCSVQPPEDQLIYDLFYASAMTRIFYERVPAPLPAADSTISIWNYYKKYYNTDAGKAQPVESIQKYQRFKGMPQESS
jgi:hypothetical protein